MCCKRSTESTGGYLLPFLLVLFLVAGLPPVRAQEATPKGAEKAAGATKDAASEKAAAPVDNPKPEQARELDEMLAVLQQFNNETKQYKQEVQHMVTTRYQERKKAVVGSYDRAISKLEQQENQLRLEAIKVFEDFLARYPDSPRYTPGALWRLAELYYEKAEVDFSADEDAYEKRLDAYNKGELKQEPVPPDRHYERTVGLLQRLTRDFPEYRLVDGAYYLLAYCLQEQGEAEQAQQTYLELARRFPKSKLMPEVWTRLGESYFEDPDKLDKAIDAYSKVLQFPQSNMYDKALYKLAWTYYKVDDYPNAVERFDKLIVWADQGQANAGGEAGRNAARGELRKEALQYLAICFAEEEWSGSGVENARNFFQQRGGRSYQAEFFRKLGEVYYIDGSFEKAIAAYRQAIREQPLAKDNPRLMAAMVEAYYRLRQPDEAAKVQEQMIKTFGPGSAWRKANQDEPEAVSNADKLAKKALYTAAVRHHTLAQRLKKEGDVEQARAEYARAAEVYADYLTRFSDSRDAYKLTFYLAECYYYSLDFEKAAQTYRAVRDSSVSNEFLADAANSVVLSYENIAKAAESEGRLEKLQVYTSKTRPAELALKPRPIPPVRQKIIAACLAYAEKLPQDEQSGNMMFRAGQIYYAYDHFDEARKLFGQIVATTGKDELVTSSINLIIESYLVTKDWEQVEKWSRKLAMLSRDPLQKKTLHQFELGARFNQATALMQAGKRLIDEGDKEQARRKLDQAALAFTKLVDEDPRGKNSDKALNNAALCYTWSSRPRSAGKIYERIVREYPRSEFADRALFLMAGSAEAAYDFAKAIVNYLKLVDRYPDSKLRADALYNAAVALEDDQQYRQAARQYERYAKLFPDRPDAADNFFRAGLMFEKAKDWRQVVAVFSRFQRRYRRTQEQYQRLVEAQGKIAEAWDKLGDRRRARKAYIATIKMYRKMKLPAGGPGAEAAAQAQFRLAEAALAGYEKITFDVPPRKLKKTLVVKAESLKEMEKRYRAVFDYKRVQWTLAAYYRLGYLYQNFADVLVNSPCPRGLSEEECDIYKGKLEELAEAPIKKATAAYQVTMDKSKEFKMVNKWTDMAYASLNRYDPLKYPLQKKPMERLVLDRLAPLPLLQAAQVGIKPAGK